MLMLMAAALNSAQTAPGPVIVQQNPELFLSTSSMDGCRVAEQNPAANVLDPQTWRTTGLL